MKKTFLLLILTITSCATTGLSKYVSIKNINIEKKECRKRYSKKGEYLMGKYKINYGGGYTTYAIYKDGYYQEVLNESKGFIWSQENYNESNDLVEYTSYFDKRSDDVNGYYQLQKYDSVKTFFLKNNPTKSIFYNKDKNYIVDYKVEQDKMKIITNIKDFRLNNSLDVFSAIPSKFFFSKCYNKKFLYSNKFNLSSRKEYLNFEIIEPTGKTEKQTFKLDNYQQKEDDKIDFYDYSEMAN